MSKHKSITNAKIIDKLQIVKAHVSNIQSAIAEGGSGEVDHKDWNTLDNLVTKYKDQANEFWTKEGPNAPFIQAIIKAYNSLANKPPKQDFAADMDAINAILDNIQKQINHLQQENPAQPKRKIA